MLKYLTSGFGRPRTNQKKKIQYNLIFIAQNIEII